MKKNSSQSQSQTKKVSSSSSTSIQYSNDNLQIDSVPAIPYAENCKISRTDFPNDFVFGVGRGAAKDGRGHNRIVDGSNGNVADDIKVMKSMGFDAYRFSISWPRILGRPCLGVNKEGIDYHNDIINTCLENGYPQNMIEETCAPISGNLRKFSIEESSLLKGSIDFPGLNYYTTYYASNDPTPDCEDGYYKDQQVKFSTDRDGWPIGPVLVPWGIYELLKYINYTYENIPDIYITENGVDEKNNSKLTAYEACTDTTRIKYHQDHLAKILEAMNDYGDNSSNGNLNIKGYFLWSWCDNFEWVEGYTVRFGIIYVDYMNNLRRYPKHSAKWFAQFLKRKDLLKRVK
ncbi:hypothetical protein ACJIZ3_001683 [Penstemon smallii]|uniref:Beta-glucosidase n=1 Tax=Penstemon smallii TaxID=265156 RepID=A0ABD3U4N2_9LAMI